MVFISYFFYITAMRDAVPCTIWTFYKVVNKKRAMAVITTMALLWNRMGRLRKAACHQAGRGYLPARCCAV